MKVENFFPQVWDKIQKKSTFCTWLNIAVTKTLVKMMLAEIVCELHTKTIQNGGKNDKISLFGRIGGGRVMSVSKPKIRKNLGFVQHLGGGSNDAIKVQFRYLQPKWERSPKYRSPPVIPSHFGDRGGTSRGLQTRLSCQKKWWNSKCFAAKGKNMVLPAANFFKSLVIELHDFAPNLNTSGTNGCWWPQKAFYAFKL